MKTGGVREFRITPLLHHSITPFLKKVAACLRRPPETKPKELKSAMPKAHRIPAEVWRDFAAPP